MGLESRLRLIRDGAITIGTACHERLTGLTHEVDIEGEAALFKATITNRRPLELLVPFTQMPAVFSEIRHAQATLLSRQRMRLDRGAGKLHELCDTALRPISLDVIVDRATNDLFFLHQFADHAPVVFRVRPAELEANLAFMEDTVRRATQ